MHKRIIVLLNVHILFVLGFKKSNTHKSFDTDAKTTQRGDCRFTAILQVDVSSLTIFVGYRLVINMAIDNPTLVDVVPMGHVDSNCHVRSAEGTCC